MRALRSYNLVAPPPQMVNSLFAAPRSLLIYDVTKTKIKTGSLTARAILEKFVKM